LDEKRILIENAHEKLEAAKNLFENGFARAQEDREEADYGLFSNIDQNEAKIIIEGAQSFLNECELNL
jgi:uncharacterized protein (UPF0332 family)